MTRRGAAIDLSLEDWNAVLALNTTAIFEVSRMMTAAARPGTSPYTASKGAVGQVDESLAVEWAAHGILVNAIAPGYIDTDLNKSLVRRSRVQ